MYGHEKPFAGSSIHRHRKIKWWVLLGVICMCISSLASIAFILKIIDLLS